MVPDAGIGEDLPCLRRVNADVRDQLPQSELGVFKQQVPDILGPRLLLRL